MLLIAFYTPWKHQKTRGFLKFSGNTERKQWHEMGYNSIVETSWEFVLNQNISDSQHHWLYNGSSSKCKNILHSNTTIISQARVITLNYIIIYIKVSARDIWFFGISCESLVEVTVQNFRLLFLTELLLSIIVRYFIITTKLCHHFVKI